MSITLDDAMRAFSPSLPLAVAYSGGADSTALLLACAEAWPGQVRAIHVHHGLQPAAEDFVRHCQDLCTRLEVPLAVERVQAAHAPGESPEDAARRARYAAIEAAVEREWSTQGLGDVALAQHADDQIETLLLALSRGAGLPGLSAMPAQWERHGLRFHRPLLRVPGPALREWLAARGATWIEDPSNAEQRYTRNRIRAGLLPALEQTFPGFRDTFARSASHAAQAQSLLVEMAQQDLAWLDTPPFIARLQVLSRARQANALRHWLNTRHRQTASNAQLGELLDQLAACTTRGHDIRLKVGQGFAVRRGERLDWYNPGVLG